MDTVVAGALAAFSVDLLIYPLDTLKTRLQAPDYATRFAGSRTLYSGLYQGVGSVIVATLPAAGIFFTTYEHSKSLLASPSSPLHGAPSGATHLLASSAAELVSCLVLTPAEVIKQRAQVINRQTASASPHLRSSAAASLGTTAAEAVRETVQRAPSDAPRTAIAHDALRNAAESVSKTAPPGSAVATARNVIQDIRTSGGGGGSRPYAQVLNRFGRSYLALAGRNLPFTAIQFPLYEALRTRLSRRFDLKAGTHADDGGVDDVRYSESFQHSTSISSGGVRVEAEVAKAGLVSATSAAIAGSVAAFVTTPVDVAKTRIMLDTDASNSTSGVSNSRGAGGRAAAAGTRGVVATMQNIAAREGWQALLRGGALRSAWTALGAAIYLGSYESGRLWWRHNQAN
ncbi:hypothetical protein ACQY0O_003571 [Thecaphora frezii]